MFAAHAARLLLALDIALPLMRQYLTPDAGHARQVAAVEFYNACARSLLPVDQPRRDRQLDSGRTVGWVRTGLRFLVHASRPPGRPGVPVLPRAGVRRLALLLGVPRANARRRRPPIRSTGSTKARACSTCGSRTRRPACVPRERSRCIASSIPSRPTTATRRSRSFATRSGLLAAVDAGRLRSRARTTRSCAGRLTLDRRARKTRARSGTRSRPARRPRSSSPSPATTIAFTPNVTPSARSMRNSPSVRQRLDADARGGLVRRRHLASRARLDEPQRRRRPTAIVST